MEKGPQHVCLSTEGSSGERGARPGGTKSVTTRQKRTHSPHAALCCHLRLKGSAGWTARETTFRGPQYAEIPLTVKLGEPLSQTNPCTRQQGHLLITTGERSRRLRPTLAFGQSGMPVPARLCPHNTPQGHRAWGCLWGVGARLEPFQKVSVSLLRP